MTINQLRRELLNLGFDLEQLKDLSKDELNKMIEEARKYSEIIESAEPSKELEAPIVDIEQEKNLRPLFTDENWTDYVLNLFNEKELENGMPKTDSLRRVAEFILGPFNSFTTVQQVPTIDNAGRATVVVQITFLDGLRQIFCGAADVYTGNTAREYAVHAVATAETRAEGRALRKALRLTKVLSAEELQGPDVDEPNGNDKRIVTGMLNSLLVMCERVGVDLVRTAIKMGFDIQVPEDLTHKQGLDISNQLSKYQRKIEEIPTEIKNNG